MMTTCPPPPATLTIPARGRDPITGWSFAQIGQQSRVMHATQGMGRWVPAGSETDFPLHLAHSHVAGPDTELASGLAATLRDLDVPAIAADLGLAQDGCDSALAAFPDAASVLSHASAALVALRRAIANCPAEVLPEIGHKLYRKEQQLTKAIQIAAGVDARGRLADDILHPGDTTTWTGEVSADRGEVTIAPRLPQGWTTQGNTVALDPDAAISDPYPAVYLPGQPAAPCLQVDLTVDGIQTTQPIAFEVPPIVVPQRSVAVAPLADVINLADQRRTFDMQVSDVFPETAKVGLRLPEGWRFEQDEATLRVTAPDKVAPGLYDLVLTLDGEEAASIHHIRRDHIAPRMLASRAAVQIRVGRCGDAGNARGLCRRWQ